MEAELHPYPLIRSGGLFLMLVGTALAIGTIWPWARQILMAAGLAVASLVTSLFAVKLARPLGSPTMLQIGVLAGSVLVETILIGVTGRLLQKHSRRTFELTVLFIVGLHLLPMSVAFGPLVAVLGLLSILNASVGLWLAHKTDLLVFWGIDGTFKMVLGAIMLFAAPS
jgi:hypothetical protein